MLKHVRLLQNEENNINMKKTVLWIFLLLSVNIAAASPYELKFKDRPGTVRTYEGFTRFKKLTGHGPGSGRRSRITITETVISNGPGGSKISIATSMETKEKENVFEKSFSDQDDYLLIRTSKGKTRVLKYRGREKPGATKSAESTFIDTRGFHLALPEGRISPGDRWSVTGDAGFCQVKGCPAGRYEFNYRFRGQREFLGRECLIITSDYRMTSSGNFKIKGSAKFLFDPLRGEVVSSSFEQVREVYDGDGRNSRIHAWGDVLMR